MTTSGADTIMVRMEVGEGKKGDEAEQAEAVSQIVLCVRGCPGAVLQASSTGNEPVEAEAQKEPRGPWESFGPPAQCDSFQQGAAQSRPPKALDPH